MCLLTYSLLVVFLGPPILTWLTRAEVAPASSVLVWLAALISVLVSWIAATAFLAADAAYTGMSGDAMWRACLGAVRTAAAGTHGWAIQAGALVILGAATAGLVRLGWRLITVQRRVRRRASGYAQAARMVGHRVAGVDAVILETGDAAAYCLADPARTMIVTTGALSALDAAQLDAVLAHERTHLAEHHHAVITVTRGLASALGPITLFRRGARQIARLLELRADDVAAAAAGRDTLLAAFSALTHPGTFSVPTRVPAEALGASGGDMVVRVQRLVTPPDPRRVRWLLGARLATAAALAGGPIVVAVMSATGVGICALAGLLTSS